MSSPKSPQKKGALKKTIKAIAQHKVKKLQSEDERKRELMKQYPKLFSPEKVKVANRKRRDLLPPSLRMELLQEEDDNVENIDANNRCNHTMPSISLEKSKTAHVPTITENGNREKEHETFHCIFDFDTDTAPSISESSKTIGVKRNSSSVSHHRNSSICQCRRSSVRRRSSVMSTISTDTYEYDDEDDEDCDICQSLASRKASRTQLMQTLRHFLRDEQLSCSSSSSSHATSSTPQLPEDSNASSVLGEKGAHSSDTCESEEAEPTPSCTPLAPPLSPEHSHSPSHHDTDASAPSTGSNSVCSFSGNSGSAEEDGEEAVEHRGRFLDILESALSEDRLRATVYGSRVKDTHVEFLIQVQVASSSDGCDGQARPALDGICEMEMVLLRRYSQFLSLFQALIDIKGLKGKIADFPKKQMLPNVGMRWKDQTFVAKREKELNKWLSQTMNSLLSSGASEDWRTAVVHQFSNFMSNACN